MSITLSHQITSKTCLRSTRACDRKNVARVLFICHVPDADVNSRGPKMECGQETLHQNESYPGSVYPT